MASKIKLKRLQISFFQLHLQIPLAPGDNLICLFYILIILSTLCSAQERCSMMPKTCLKSVSISDLLVPLSQT